MPVAQEVARAEVVKLDASLTAAPPRALPLVPNSVPKPDREWETSKFFRSSHQRSAAPERDQAPSVSKRDSELSPDRFLNALRPAPGRSLRWIAAIMRWSVSPAATRHQTPNRHKLLWTALARGAARHCAASNEVIRHAFLRLVRSSSGWRDRCSSQLKSGSWRQVVNRSYRWLRGPIHPVQPFLRWFERRDRYLSAISSKSWEQMAESLSRWLREPFDPARWLAESPHMLDAGRALSQKKP
jgi:hypothetical protein